MNEIQPVREPRLPIPDMILATAAGMREALSPREHDVVVALSAEGQSNQDIGVELFISERTVRTHFVSIMHKLDATSRTQVLIHAQRLGLLDEPDKLSPTARTMRDFILAYPDAFREIIAAGALDVPAPQPCAA